MKHVALTAKLSAIADRLDATAINYS